MIIRQTSARQISPEETLPAIKAALVSIGLVAFKRGDWCRVLALTALLSGESMRHA
jgi:hypothetical protein